MGLENLNKLKKLKRKKRGDVKLSKAIDKLISDLETNKFKTPLDLREIRPDADCVHSEGFYFFDLDLHRTLILIDHEDLDFKSVAWVGSHDDYTLTFGNNKDNVERWLKVHGWI